APSPTSSAARGSPSLIGHPCAQGRPRRVATPRRPRRAWVRRCRRTRRPTLTDQERTEHRARTTFAAENGAHISAHLERAWVARSRTRRLTATAPERTEPLRRISVVPTLRFNRTPPTVLAGAYAADLVAPAVSRSGSGQGVIVSVAGIGSSRRRR